MIDLARGDHLIRQGQISCTLYLVLEGSLEVWEDGYLVGVAMRGESLGEVAFLLGGARMSDVTAVTDDVRVLALNEKGLQQLIETDSGIAARFLLYLSKCLCLKLRERSQGAGVRS